MINLQAPTYDASLSDNAAHGLELVLFCLAEAGSNGMWRMFQYLDENKQLILAILDNQNLGKLNDCAM